MTSNLVSDLREAETSGRGNGGHRDLCGLAANEIERLTKIANSAVAGRHAFRQMHIRSRNALKRAIEWASPMAEAPVESRPAWFDIAREALSGVAPDETTSSQGAQVCPTCGGHFFLDKGGAACLPEEPSACPKCDAVRKLGLTSCFEHKQPEKASEDLVPRDSHGHAIGHPKDCRINNGMDMTCNCGAESEE